MYRKTLLLLVFVLAACGDNSQVCGDGTVNVGGICLPEEETGLECGPGTVADGDACVFDGMCADGTSFDVVSNTCVPDIAGCGDGLVEMGGLCVDPATTPADIQEPSEPNDDLPATVIDLDNLPVTISGCTTPTEHPDEDPFLIRTFAPGRVLRVTVDGYGGMLGGFRIDPIDAELAFQGWERFGVAMAGDVASRSFWLPIAGDYEVVISDTRSLLNGLAAGAEGACYRATVEDAAAFKSSGIPGEVTGTLDGNVRMYNYTSGTLELLYAELESDDTVLSDLGVVKGGEFFSVAGNPGFARSLGSTVTSLVVADDPTEAVLLVVDPIVILALEPPSYTLRTYVHAPYEILGDEVLALPGDFPLGTFLYSRLPANSTMYTQGIVNLPGGVYAQILDADLNPAGSLCTGPCPVWSSTYYAIEEQLVFVHLLDADAQGDDVPLTLTAEQKVAPVADLSGAPGFKGTTGPSGSTFIRLSSSGSPSWTDWGGNPTELQVYRPAASGILNDSVRSLDDFTTLSAVSRVYDADTPYLLRISGPGQLPSTPYSVISTPAPMTHVAPESVLLGAVVGQFTATIPRFARVVVTARPADNSDLVITQQLFDGSFQETDIGASSELETVIMENWSHTALAFQVRDYFGAPAVFDLELTVLDKPPGEVSYENIPFATICPFLGGAGDELGWIPVTGSAWLANDEGWSGFIPLPFTGGSFYGDQVMQLNVNTNGLLSFVGNDVFTYTPLPFPSGTLPGIIAPFWQDLFEVRSCWYGSDDEARIEWFAKNSAQDRVHVQVALFPDGSVHMSYSPATALNTATPVGIGMSNLTGTSGFTVNGTIEGAVLPNAAWVMAPSD